MYAVLPLDFAGLGRSGAGVSDRLLQPQSERLRELRDALLESAYKCPVHRTLAWEVAVTTRLAGDGSAHRARPDVLIDRTAS